jgi:hypothetical protein
MSVQIAPLLLSNDRESFTLLFHSFGQAQDHMTRMKILTQEILRAFTKQGNTDNMEPTAIKIICKFFNPTGVGTWYCYEYDGNDRMWCFAELGDKAYAECGTASMKELQELQLPHGLKIERDKFFPIGKYTLQEVMDKIKAGGSY